MKKITKKNQKSSHALVSAKKGDLATISSTTLPQKKHLSRSMSNNVLADYVAQSPFAFDITASDTRRPKEVETIDINVWDIHHKLSNTAFASLWKENTVRKSVFAITNTKPSFSADQRRALMDSFTRSYGDTELAASPIAPATPKSRGRAEPKTTVINIWEGEVVKVFGNENTMDVILRDKTGNLTDHAATISLEWVSSQDLDLVIPGAIFYLTLYKETKRGSISNSQELRFRRLPTWSQSQIAKIHSEAERLLSTFSTKPTA